MIDIDRTLRLLDVEAESNFVQAEAIDAINYLLGENARLREALKVAANFLDDAYTDIGRDEYKVAGFVARAERAEAALRDIAEGCSFPEDEVQKAVRDRARAVLAQIEKETGSE